MFKTDAAERAVVTPVSTVALKGKQPYVYEIPAQKSLLELYQQAVGKPVTPPGPGPTPGTGDEDGGKKNKTGMIVGVTVGVVVAVVAIALGVYFGLKSKKDKLLQNAQDHGTAVVLQDAHQAK